MPEVELPLLEKGLCVMGGARLALVQLKTEM